MEVITEAAASGGSTPQATLTVAVQAVIHLAVAIVLAAAAVVKVAAVVTAAPSLDVAALVLPVMELVHND